MIEARSAGVLETELNSIQGTTAQTKVRIVKYSLEKGSTNDFPAPFAPTMATLESRPTSKLTLLRIRFSGE
jgi:hypothetical protein